jgi:hypothetical protein
MTIQFSRQGRPHLQLDALTSLCQRPRCGAAKLSRLTSISGLTTCLTSCQLNP